MGSYLPCWQYMRSGRSTGSYTVLLSGNLGDQLSRAGEHALGYKHLGFHCSMPHLLANAFGSQLGGAGSCGFCVRGRVIPRIVLIG